MKRLAALSFFFFLVVSIASAFDLSLAGNYTLVLRNGESNAGYGTLKISQKGIAHIVLTLANGRTLSASSSVAADGTLPLFLKNRTDGVLSGNVTFADKTNTDLTADIIWQRPNSTAQFLLIGSSYANAAPVLDVSNTQNGVLLFLGTNSSQASSFGLLGNNNSFSFSAASALRTAAQLNVNNGIVSGKMQPFGARNWTKFHGVIFQKQNLASGLLAISGANFTIVPGQPNNGNSSSGATGAITVTGSNTNGGTLVLSGSNTYTGGTTVSGGSLTFGYTSGGVSGATLELSGGSTYTGGTNISTGSLTLGTSGSGVMAVNVVTSGNTLSVDLTTGFPANSISIAPLAKLNVHALSGGDSVTITFINSGTTSVTLTNLQSAVDAAVAAGQTTVDLATPAS